MDIGAGLMQHTVVMSDDMDNSGEMLIVLKHALEDKFVHKPNVSCVAKIFGARTFSALFICIIILAEVQAAGAFVVNRFVCAAMTVVAAVLALVAVSFMDRVLTVALFGTFEAWYIFLNVTAYVATSVRLAGRFVDGEREAFTHFAYPTVAIWCMAWMLLDAAPGLNRWAKALFSFGFGIFLCLVTLSEEREGEDLAPHIEELCALSHCTDTGAIRLMALVPLLLFCFKYTVKALWRPRELNIIRAGVTTSLSTGSAGASLEKQDSRMILAGNSPASPTSARESPVNDYVVSSSHDVLPKSTEMGVFRREEAAEEEEEEEEKERAEDRMEEFGPQDEIAEEEETDIQEEDATTGKLTSEEAGVTDIVQARPMGAGDSKQPKNPKIKTKKKREKRLSSSTSVRLRALVDVVVNACCAQVESLRRDMAQTAQALFDIQSKGWTSLAGGHPAVGRTFICLGCPRLSGHYVREKHGYAFPASMGSDAAFEAAAFCVVQGLASGSSFVSFECKAKRGHYLRLSQGRVVVEKERKQQSWAREASWRVRKPLWPLYSKSWLNNARRHRREASTGSDDGASVTGPGMLLMSLESVSKGQHYMRIENSTQALKVERLQRTEGFQRNATFGAVPFAASTLVRTKRRGDAGTSNVSSTRLATHLPPELRAVRAAVRGLGGDADRRKVGKPGGAERAPVMSMQVDMSARGWVSSDDEEEEEEQEENEEKDDEAVDHSKSEDTAA